MDIFVSSIITGFEAERAAVREAITTLGHQPVMAEDLQAQPNSPQVACLQALRRSDLVVSVLGERYGWVPPGSQIAPTHEEFRAAKGNKPILVFVQDGTSPEPEQAAFLEEVGDWNAGQLFKKFVNTDDLGRKATRAISDHAIANAVAPLNETDLVQRLMELFPASQPRVAGNATLDVGLSVGPKQSLLRPIQIEDRNLAKTLQKEASFGEFEIFDPAVGTNSEQNEDLVLRQPTGASIRLTEAGSMLLRLPLDLQAGGRSQMSMPVIVQEDVEHRLRLALGYANWLLDHIDETQRATHVAIGLRIANSGHRPWRTRAEHVAQPKSMTMGLLGQQDVRPVHLVKPRAALRVDTARLIEDLVVPLRRKFHRG